MKKVLTIFMVAIMSILTLAACGNDNTTSGAVSKENTETVSTEDNAETVSTEDNVLLVGTNAEFPPFEYVGDNGEPDGFDMALIKEIGKKMGMEVKIENMEFASLISAIGTKIDLAISGMTIDEERKLSVDFSDPYYEAMQYVIVLEGSDIANAVKDDDDSTNVSMADLENKTIGVQLGTTGDFAVQDDIAGATSQQYNKAVDAVNDLINGRVDAVIVDKNPALVFEEKFAGQVVAIDGALFEFEKEYYAIALPKGSELVSQVNQALADLKADGTFDALVEEYIEAGK